MEDVSCCCTEGGEAREGDEAPAVSLAVEGRDSPYIGLRLDAAV